MRFVYKNLAEKYIRVLEEEHSEKDSLVRIINDMSLSQDEMYATLLKELTKSETEEDFLISVENLRDVARASYASDARAYARVLNFRMLVDDAKKLGYPELANAVDAALMYIHQDSMSKRYRSTERPERGLILLRRVQFKAAFARSQDEKRARVAQQQHTSTHGVDLSNLEEMFNDHEPWPDDLFERANNAIFDAIINWNEEENILPKKVKEYTDSTELFSDLVQGILNKYRKQANETKSLQVFVAEIMGKQLKKYLPKGFSKNDMDTWLGPALGDFTWGSWNIQSAIDDTEWVGNKTMRQAAIDAQRQHTKTHGVDLTDL